VSDHLSVTVGLIKVRAKQLKKKLVVDAQIFRFTVDRDLLYGPWDYPVFHLHARVEFVVQPQAMELALWSVARLSVVNDNWMLAHVRFKNFFLRRGINGMRRSRTNIPPSARVAPVVQDFCGNYFREPRNNALREGFKITDEITFLDEFEERPKFLPR